MKQGMSKHYGSHINAAAGHSYVSPSINPKLIKCPSCYGGLLEEYYEVRTRMMVCLVCKKRFTIEHLERIWTHTDGGSN